MEELDLKELFEYYVSKIPIILASIAFVVMVGVGYIVFFRHIKKVYVPMTETGFYILFCLQEEMHGYNIGLKVKDMTNGELTISPGTMYGTLSKMENDNLISFVKEEDKRKSYIITELGKEVLEIELKRIERLYRNSKGEQ